MKSFFTSVLTILTLNIFAQSSIAEIANIQPVKVSSYQLPPLADYAILKFAFGRSSLLNAEKAKWLQPKVITKIEMVWSFNHHSSFNQKKLNLARLQELQVHLPQVFENEMIEWVMIAVDKHSSVQEASKLPHGFVVHYRPIPTKNRTESEIRLINSWLDDTAPASETEVVFDPIETSHVETPSKLPEKAENYCELLRQENVPDSLPKFPGGCKALRALIKTAVESVGVTEKMKAGTRYSGIEISFPTTSKYKTTYYNFDPTLNTTLIHNELRELENVKPKPDAEQGYVIHASLIITITKKEIRCKVGRIELRARYGDFSGAILSATPVLGAYLRDEPAVINFFKRHKDLGKMAIVCDVTGSMYPYTTQVLQWHKLYKASHSENMVYCFFNDGDNKHYSEKKIGSTGGVYMASIGSYDELQKLMFTAMRNGAGGDAPENNFEATLKAINSCKDCEDVIMIADNWAVPRDVSLLQDIDKPIKFIMCGAGGGINPQYLDLARRNGGSIHTVESDISHLAEIAEGMHISIDGVNYQLVEGKFVRK